VIRDNSFMKKMAYTKSTTTKRENNI